MDKQDASQSLTARNREHQRNFRARRQQYVQELEQKLKEYEQSQLEITQKVQTAARVVVSENRVLRNLLQDRLGMSNEDIDNHVMEARKDQSTMNESSLLRYEPVSSSAKLSSSTCGSLDSVSSSTKVTRSELPTETSADPTPDYNSVNDNEPINDQMHCEQAANIIMSIQTESSIDDVRQDLGCGPRADCSIRNAAVLQLMDARI